MLITLFASVVFLGCREKTSNEINEISKADPFTQIVGPLKERSTNLPAEAIAKSPLSSRKPSSANFQCRMDPDDSDLDIQIAQWESLSPQKHLERFLYAAKFLKNLI